MNKRYLYRNAKTGRAVTKAYAEANPDTTERETVDLPKRFTGEEMHRMVSGELQAKGLPGLHAWDRLLASERTAWNNAAKQLQGI